MKEIRNDLKTWGYLPKQKLLVAVSGGVDSMSLLTCLVDLYGPGNIHAAHFNHQLRPESHEEEGMVKSYCHKLGVQFHSKTWSKPARTNIEAQARKARYKFFTQVLTQINCSWLATGHHQGDFSETILMRLIQGVGLIASTGMDEVSQVDLHGVKFNLIRPFHTQTKDDIYHYAHSNNIPYREDSSNQSNDYLRNRIRNQILPLLKKENPRIDVSLTELAKLVKASYQTNLINYKKIEDDLVRRNDTSYVLQLANWLKLSKEEQITYMELFIDEDLTGLIPDLNRQVILDLVDLINSDSGPNKKLDLAGGYVARLEYDQIIIEKPQTIDKDQAIIINQANHWYQLSDREKIAVLDKNTDVTNSLFIPIKYQNGQNLTVRRPRPGDRMKLASGEGYITKKISRIFIDEKVPTVERENSWLVEDQVGEIVWLVGYRRAFCEDGDFSHKICFVKS